MNPANRTANKFALLLIALMAGPIFYWGFTYTGPYRYLAELQLKWFGVYYPEATGLVIFLGMLAIVGVAKVLLQGAERPVPGASAPVSNRMDISEAAAQRWMRFLPYVVVPVLVGIGASDYYKGARAGSLHQLDAAQFYNGEPQSGMFYASVHGRLSGTYLHRDDYYYVPMTVDEKTAGPIRLLIGANKNELQKSVHREADGTVRIWGVVEKDLEGEVKYAFEKNGYSMSDTVWVLHAGRAPSDQKGLGLFIMGFGALAGIFLFVVQRFKERRKKAASSPVQVTA